MESNDLRQDDRHFGKRHNQGRDGTGMKHVEMYRTADRQTQIEVKFEGESIWLSLNQLADLFGWDKSVISRHLNNIYKE